MEGYHFAFLENILCYTAIKRYLLYTSYMHTCVTKDGTGT